MFEVCLVKCIWTHPEKIVQEAFGYGGSSNSDGPKVAILKRFISLPFAPFIGVEVSGDGWNSGPLQRVTWGTTDEQFLCTVADEYPRTVNGSELTYEFLLENNLYEGWLRPDTGGGDAPRLKP
ncbi:MAG: hypothetical protein EPO43_13555 [Rugosibacter sp.]|nr:MAG: hypothetical protein EPO43_13555 [Rugosibacter sp.]